MTANLMIFLKTSYSYAQLYPKLYKKRGYLMVS